METFKFILSIIEAIGSIATAISLIILLTKYRKRLKVSGELPIKNSRHYLLKIYNSTMYDSEICSISLFKGNPKSTIRDSVFISSIPFENEDLIYNPNTKNLLIPKDSCVEYPIPHETIVDAYQTIGESFGKPFDKIYIFLHDNKGFAYSVNTKINIDGYKRLIQK